MPTATETTTFVCAWCDRVLVDGVWRAPEGRHEPSGAVSHGICEDCAEDVGGLAPLPERE